MGPETRPRTWRGGGVLNTREDGRRLISEAHKLFDRDVHGALRDDDYNMVVRRAQEAVELCLKGALRVLCVDYPKVHDVGPVFSDQVRQKIGSETSEDVLDRIETISLWLSQARAPSFYREKIYTEEDATKAFQDADYVLSKMQSILGDYF